MILAAINNNQLTAALNIASGSSMVAFATLDERVPAKIENTSEYIEGREIHVYFYETG